MADSQSVRSPGTILLLAVVLAATFAFARPPVQNGVSPVVAEAAEALGHGARAAAANLPLAFVPNRGQTDQQVHYLARGAGYVTFLTSSGAVLRFDAPAGVTPQDAVTPGSASTRAVIGMRLVGNEGVPAVSAGERLPGVINYLVGSDAEAWQTGLPQYGQVHYRAVYPGIDLIFRGQDGALRYDFVVVPGGDPSDIRLAFDGADSVTVGQDGELILRLGDEEVHWAAPRLFQEVDGVRRTVNGSYRLHGSQVGFEVGPHDPNLPLVIDPVLAYSTLLGGSQFDGAEDVVVSGDRAYLAGETGSSDFPTAGNLFQNAAAGDNDAFVAALDTDHSGTASLVFTTYFGGTEFDEATGVALDASDNVHLFGGTRSTNLPIKNGFQTALATKPRSSRLDAFVAKLDPGGSSLLYSTYLGGTTEDQSGDGMALDASGRTYVAGHTFSDDFPTKNALAGTRAGGFDAFVTKIDTEKTGGDSLVYSTYLGGGSFEVWTDVDVDPTGAVYVSGYTGSDDFPTTANGFQTILAGLDDAFVAKLDPSGSSLSYSTYLGGALGFEGQDINTGIAVDDSGQVFVTGDTQSADFPTRNAFQATLNPAVCGVLPCLDGFVTRLDTTASGLASLVYSSFLGGSNHDAGKAIATDGAGTAFVVGNTLAVDFPTRRALQRFGGGALDGFLARVDTNAIGDGSLLYSTFLGGEEDEGGTGVATDGRGGAFVVGATDSADWPVTGTAFQSVLGGTAGEDDAFLTKVATESSQEWTDTGSLVDPRFGHTATLLADGRVLAAGGCATAKDPLDGPCEAHTVSAELFDPSTDTWAATGSMIEARATHTATLLDDGRVLAAGGCLTPSDVRTCSATTTSEFFDPDTGSWSAAALLGEVRRLHSATRLDDGRVLVVGGLDENQTLSSAEIFDPGSGMWSTTVPMSTPRYGHTATRLAGGRVLVTGGEDAVGPSASPLASAELFDPVSETWTAVGSLSDAREFHTATLLTNGMVLVAGGSGPVGTSIRSAETFDPSTATWSSAAAMPIDRVLHAGRRLDDGRILVAGGASSDGSGIFPTIALLRGTADIYDPASDRWTSAGNMAESRSGADGNPAGHTATVLPDGRVLLVGGTVAKRTETFEPTADLTVTKADSPDPAPLGGELIYTVSVINQGPQGASQVTVTDTLPSSVVFLEATASQGSCSHASGTVSCNLAELAPEASATVEITVEPQELGDATNTASVAAVEADPDGSNNTAAETTTVENIFGCTIIGTPGDDTLTGTDSADVICGLAGNDVINGAEGDDRLIGSSGNDHLMGADGDNRLEGDRGDDLLEGHDSADVLIGGDGADTLKGGDGDDTLDGVDGVSGNDDLDGGGGTDSCTADAGDTVTNCP